MTMQKEKMRSLKEDATVADDEHWSYPKVRKCARMIKSGQVPEDLQQLYEEGSQHSPPPRLFKSQFINKVFQSFSRTPEVSLCLLLEIPSVRSFQEQLWDLHQQISVYWVGLGCGQNPGKPASFEWCRKTGDVYQKDGYYHVKTIATAIEKKQGSSLVLHGQLTKDEYSQMSQSWASLALELVVVVVVVAVVVVVVVAVLPLHQLWLFHPQHCQSDLWCSCETEQGKCSQERLGRDCQRPDVKIFDKKDQKPIILWWMSSPSFQRQNVCLRLLHWSFDVV